MRGFDVNSSHTRDGGAVMWMERRTFRMLASGLLMVLLFPRDRASR
jgi:hypothetical protein